MLKLFKFFDHRDKFSHYQIERLTKRLMEEEGFRCCSYWDNKQWTYGYGTKAPHAEAYINKTDAKRALDKEVKRAINEYNWVRHRCPFRINEVRREALTNMIFNMGLPTFKTFKYMLKLIFNNNDNDWDKVAAAARNSKWYKQTGERAHRICRELETGEYQLPAEQKN
jgi:lysozyme